jgi:hypothetical protein
MRADTTTCGAPPTSRVEVRPPVRKAAPRRRGLAWFELGLLALFGAVSVWVLALDLWQVVAHNRVWTGTDGFYLVDQMQYLAWIRQASHGVLAANLFVLRPTPADYFQPAIAISGALTAAGMAPWLALLLWKPVAVLTAFFGVRSYVYRSLHGVWARRAGLALGLFFGSFTVVYGSFGVLGDVFPAFLSWGYTFGLLALGAMLFALVSYDRSRSRRELPWRAGLLGAFASSLHPWQGELLILIILGTELALWRSERRAPRRLSMPALAVIATGVPLIYYEVLGHTDSSWELGRVASKHTFSILTIALAVLPLALPAMLAYRHGAVSFMARATRIWPLGALVIYALSATAVSATPLHAFEGITVPLTILAIAGIRRTRFSRLHSRRLIGGLAVAAATIPATVYELHSAPPLVAPSAGNANFITGDERQALRYLASDPAPGGVLTRFYLGAVVPAETGRRTFVGDCLWSQPGCTPRAQIAQMVFDGSLSADVSRWFVNQTGARFVLTDCRTRPDMANVLAPLASSVHRFGCAAVYQLGSVSPPVGPLAESPPDAALRASGRNQRRVQHG